MRARTSHEGPGLETRRSPHDWAFAEETARNHSRALLRATGAHSRLEAVVTGLRWGLQAPELTQAGQEESPRHADE